MAALEKSNPLDRRGSTDAGDGYEAEDSGLGETGMRFVRFAVLVLLMSLGGICKLRPRGATLGLLGVTGPEGTSRSSLEERRPSVNDGDGDNIDLKSWDDHGLLFLGSSEGCSSSKFATVSSQLPFSWAGWVI